MMINVYLNVFITRPFNFGHLSVIAILRKGKLRTSNFEWLVNGRKDNKNLQQDGQKVTEDA